MSYREKHNFFVANTKYIGHAGVDFSETTEDQLARLWLETLQNGMHGLCFSMYEDGQKPGDIITEAQVQKRISIIKPKVYRCIILLSQPKTDTNGFGMSNM